MESKQMENKQNLKIVIIFAVSLILSAIIISNGISSISNSKNIITVTGSAREQITSDFGQFSLSLSAKGKSADEAYKLAESNLKYVLDFYKKINNKDVKYEIGIIQVSAIEKIDKNGYGLNEINYYIANTSVILYSNKVHLIDSISKVDTRELYNLNSDIMIGSPSYTSSKVQDLKISMQAKATLDAKERAIKIAEASGVSIDKLVNARMGVIQIVPRGSNEVSDWGTNDESTIEKDIIAVVNVSFNVR